MVTFQLEKKDMNRFLASVMDNYELIAPVKTDLVRFETIKDPKDVYLTQNSFYPLKEFFFRKEETIFEFDGSRITVPLESPKKRVFFGIRRCDLNAIMHQDVVFLGESDKIGKHGPDPYYRVQREKTILIGYHCNSAPSEYCFCGSMNLKDYYDLMFFERKSHFIVDVQSKKGEIFARKFPMYLKPADYVITDKDKAIEFTDRLKEKDLSDLYDNPMWKTGVDMCLSCGACTTLCPTCYCFELHDKVDIHDTKKSKRQRSWSSCQLKEFSQVAGNHVFRDSREQRFKHRIYHQLQYFREQHGVDLCVGCARCITACPTRIDFVQIINKMADKSD